MVPLRQLLARFDQPVDVDTLRGEVDSAVRAVEGHAVALRRRIARLDGALREATDAARERAEEVARLDKRTRGGLVGAMLSSMNSEGVEEARREAGFLLSGDLSVLEARVEDARAAGEQVQQLMDDARFGAEVLERLRARAVAGDLEAELISFVGCASQRVGAVAGRVAGMAAPLDGPVRDAKALAQQAGEALADLRGSARASTVGEAFLDGVVSPDSGPLGQLAREAVAKRAPRLVPELDRQAGGRAAALAEVHDERAEARERSRRDVEARRAAEAELDALEWDR